MAGERKRFIDSYVAAFLASRAAINHGEWCAMDEHDKLTTDQPIEDAIFQAEETWKLYQATAVAPKREAS